LHPIRDCVGCGQTDDHPRHVHALPDGSTANFHMDCCAIIRRCEVCKAQLDGVGGVEGNPKGQSLRDHLVTTGPGADRPGWTAPADDKIVEG
jgi:hypothetical protein